MAADAESRERFLEAESGRAALTSDESEVEEVPGMTWGSPRPTQAVGEENEQTQLA